MTLIPAHHDDSEDGDEGEEDLALSDAPHLRPGQPAEVAQPAPAHYQFDQRGRGNEKTDSGVVPRHQLGAIHEAVEEPDDSPEEREAAHELQQEVKPNQTIIPVRDHNEGTI